MNTNQFFNTVDNCLRQVQGIQVTYFTRNAFTMGHTNNPKYGVEFRPINETQHFYRVEYSIYNHDFSLLEIIPYFNFDEEPTIIHHIEGSYDINSITRFFEEYMNRNFMLNNQLPVFHTHDIDIIHTPVHEIANAAWSQ